MIVPLALAKIMPGGSGRPGVNSQLGSADGSHKTTYSISFKICTRYVAVSDFIVSITRNEMLTRAV